MAFPKGKSGNPSGRPPGKTLGGRLREAVGAELDEIVAYLIAAAKAGDTAAAGLLLSRVIPAVKPVQEPVKVKLTGETLAQKAEAVIDAVAKGSLSPADGKALLDGMAAVARIVEVTELLARIEKLEAEHLDLKTGS